MSGCANQLEPTHQNNDGHSRPPPPSLVAVIMVPLPIQGHLNQLLHLSHLIAAYGIPVHYVGSTIHNRQAKLRLHGHDHVHDLNTSNIAFHDFSLPYFHSPPPDPNSSIKFPSHLQSLFDATTHLRHPVADLLHHLSSRYDKIVVIHDSLMGSVVQDMELITNAESYTFHSISAFSIFFFFWELLGKPFQLKYDDDVPRFVPINEGCFTAEFLEFIEKQYKFLGLNSGRLYNTSRVIEGRYMDLLGKLSINTGKKLFAVGPFNPVVNKGNGGPKHGCLEWLDQHEKNSVIYVSFGTTTSINDELIKELAMGLERSEQKFIWVLRDADKGNGDFSGVARRPLLPEGFEERVKAKGIVVREWAPQLEILEHPSTGGFMSHCGWNSCIESISLGVPIATWPMHSDQPKNATLVTEVLKVGLVVKDWNQRDEVVKAATVENAVRRLMASSEGEEMRRRAKEIGASVRDSVANNGVSRCEMDSFIAHITRSQRTPKR
ncbi:hypothetical protein Drorol1_Dr00012808 [Drosera rotundifolia]